jgi:hypothetical protein
MTTGFIVRVELYLHFLPHKDFRLWNNSCSSRFKSAIKIHIPKELSTLLGYGRTVDIKISVNVPAVMYASLLDYVLTYGLTCRRHSHWHSECSGRSIRYALVPFCITLWGFCSSISPKVLITLPIFHKTTVRMDVTYR